MIEDVIKELIESIDGLKKVMQEQAAEGCCSDKPKANTKTKKTKEVKKEAPIKEVKKEEPIKEEPEVEAVSKQTVSDALLALARQDGGRDKAISLLNEYNAEKISEVAEEDYAELLGKLQDALGED